MEEYDRILADAREARAVLLAHRQKRRATADSSEYEEPPIDKSSRCPACNTPIGVREGLFGQPDDAEYDIRRICRKCGWSE